MNQQRQQSRSHDNPRRAIANHAQDAINNRIKHSGISHDAKIQNCKDKHSRYGSNVLNSFDDEAACFEAKATD